MWRLIKNLNKHTAHFSSQIPKPTSNFSSQIPKLRCLYQHILPNPSGYEAIKVSQLKKKDPTVKTEIVDCPQTYITNACVTIPKDQQSYIKITYLHTTTLGQLHVHIYRPITRIYSIVNDQVIELHEINLNDKNITDLDELNSFSV